MDYSLRYDQSQIRSWNFRKHSISFFPATRQNWCALLKSEIQLSEHSKDNDTFYRFFLSVFKYFTSVLMLTPIYLRKAIKDTFQFPVLLLVLLSVSYLIVPSTKYISDLFYWDIYGIMYFLFLALTVGQFSVGRPNNRIRNEGAKWSIWCHMMNCSKTPILSLKEKKTNWKQTNWPRRGDCKNSGWLVFKITRSCFSGGHLL